jgi:hypothetical protein
VSQTAHINPSMRVVGIPVGILRLGILGSVRRRSQSAAGPGDDDYFVLNAFSSRRLPEWLAVAAALFNVAYEV